MTTTAVREFGLVFLGWVGGGGLGGEPFVQGDGEGEELFFAVCGVDHLDVELGVFEGGVVELARRRRDSRRGCCGG